MLAVADKAALYELSLIHDGNYYFSPLPPPREVSPAKLPENWEAYGKVDDPHALIFPRGGYLIFFAPPIAAYCAVAAPKVHSEQRMVVQTYGRMLQDQRDEIDRLQKKVLQLEADLLERDNEIAILQNEVEKARNVASDADNNDLFKGIAMAAKFFSTNGNQGI